jgi:hypothetical protein
MPSSDASPLVSDTASPTAGNPRMPIGRAKSLAARVKALPERALSALGHAVYKTAEYLEKLGTRVFDAVLMLLLYLALVPVEWKRVRLRSYPTPGTTPDATVEQAEFLFELQRDDSAHTDDKVKQLLTLSASLAGITLVFGQDVRPRWPFALLIGLLVAVGLLCVSVIGVRSGMVPTPVPGSGDEADIERARDLMQSYDANVAAHGYRADRYRAATRYFRLALILTPVLALMMNPRPNPTQDLANSVQRLEHDGIVLRYQIGRSPDSAARPVYVTPRATAPTTGRPAARSDGSAKHDTARPPSR